MAIKVSMRQLQERLAELLDQVARHGAEYLVQRDGKNYAVIVNPQQWQRRSAGRRLDALGSGYRLSRRKQVRAEQLLGARQQRALTATERRELRELLKESDAVLERRSAALDRNL